MRRLRLLLGAALLFVGLTLISRSNRVERIAVSGHSMEPGLLHGDWLFVIASSAPVQVGTVVVAHDPRMPDRLIVKRVGEVVTDSQLFVVSDHPAHSDDRIGPVSPSDVIGRAVFRYWPPSRVGFVR